MSLSRTTWTCEEHDDCIVIHEGGDCPVCDLVDETVVLEARIEELEAEIEEAADAE